MTPCTRTLPKTPPTRNLVSRISPPKEPATSPPSSPFDRISLWIGLAGSVITIILTIWNSYTKTQIDKRQEELNALEVSLKARATGIDESRERVERYKWVLSLFPSLNGQNEKERTFSVNLVRLALTQDEAEHLFAGLISSSDTSLQSLGQNGIYSIRNEPIAYLVSQLNAEEERTRLDAFKKLERDYKSSSHAISHALGMYEPARIAALSPGGIVNGIRFLNATQPDAWTGEQAAAARHVVDLLSRSRSGPKIKDALERLTALVNTLDKP